jgi:hypothetical protein
MGDSRAEKQSGMIHVTESTVSESDSKAAKQLLADYFGPGQVDMTARQAIHFCWMVLPHERKTPDELERQVRRIVDRALKDFREDAAVFTKRAGGTP